MARVETDAGKGRDPLAWFDAGYFVESYKQVSSAFNRNTLDVGKLPGELSSVDGYGTVKKALLLSGSNPELEFAASLMMSGTASTRAGRRTPLDRPARTSARASGNRC
jgi:hypothetical protein